MSHQNNIGSATSNANSLSLREVGETKESWKVADAIEYALLKENAKVNRNKMTEAESVFWSLARGSGLGEKCRRQYIIGRYIVDFFFRKSMLIVELDGGYHRPRPQQESVDYPLKEDLQPKQLTGEILVDMANTAHLNSVERSDGWINDSGQIERDKQRQDWLESIGYTVLRFTNEQVLFDAENVIKIVKQNLL